MGAWAVRPLIAALILGGCGMSSAAEASLPPPQLISGPISLPPGCGAGAASPGQPGEPSLAVDPTDRSRLVTAWLDNRTPETVGIVVAVSSDSGKHWSRSALGSLLVCAGGIYIRASDPWVSIGPDGAIYVSALMTRPLGAATSNDVAVSVSRDHGMTWSPPVVVATTTMPSARLDKDAILADQRHAGIAYAVWADYAVTAGVEPSVDTIMFARTTDGGTTWSPPAKLYGGGDEAQENQLVMTAGGVLVEVFVEASSLPGTAAPPPLPVKIRVMRSTDQGQSWSAPVDAAGFTYTTATDPGSGGELRASGQDIVATASGNAIYVAWFETHRDFSTILTARSDDAGRSWRQPQLAVREPWEAFLPTVAVAGDGTLGMLWYDLRHYRRGSGSLDTDVWFSISSDRGSHWSERHAAGPFDLRAAPASRYGPFIGDYMGLVGLPGGFGAAFVMSRPASRHGPTDVFYSSITA